MNQQIGRQDLSHQKELKTKLLQVIAQYPKGLTRNEMLIKSGVSQELIDFTLRSILEEYAVHLEISQNYEVLYVFDVDNPKNKKLGTTSQLKKILQTIARGLIFGGAIALLLAWVSMTIPIAFTLLGLYLVVGFFQIFFNQGFAVGIKEYLVYWLGRKEQKDKLAEEKVILSYISENGYYIVIAELMKIMDWSYAQAEQEAVWLLVNYGGEPIVEDSGVIIFDFNHLKDERNTGKQLSQEYVIYQRNKIANRLEYQKEPIEVSKVDVFSFKRWDKRTYLTMKVYLMNYYMAAVLFLATLVGAITIWLLSNSGGDLSALNGGRPLSSEEEANMQVLFLAFFIGYPITFLLAMLVIGRWFLVQLPAKKAEQISIFKSVLHEYIFEVLPTSASFSFETLYDKLVKYAALLPKTTKIKSIAYNEVLKEVLADFRAEVIPQEDGTLVYSLQHIAQELEAVKVQREGKKS